MLYCRFLLEYSADTSAVSRLPAQLKEQLELLRHPEGREVLDRDPAPLAIEGQFRHYPGVDMQVSSALT